MVVKWIAMTVFIAACPRISVARTSSNAAKQKQLNRAIAFAAGLEIYASGLEINPTFAWGWAMV